MLNSLRLLALGGLLAVAAMADAQPVTPTAAQPAAAPAGEAATICGQPVQPPRKLPPAGSGPVVYLIAPCFSAQGDASLVDVATYVYWIKLKTSLPSQNIWVPYDEAAEDQMRADFKALWALNFLDNLSIETADYRFSNG